MRLGTPTRFCISTLRSNSATLASVARVVAPGGTFGIDLVPDVPKWREYENRVQLRGRAGGAWVVAIGLAPLGQIQIGALASLFGVSAALGASGLGLVALAGATALLYPRLRTL